MTTASIQNSLTALASGLLKHMRRFARRRILVCVAMALLPVLIRSAYYRGQFPDPLANDEFSYLLGADTFALGRITNPPHPMWEHFETVQVISQPTYASRYPPAQALFMAAGKKFLGHPLYGVWISFGLLCGCLCWMLQGWMPPLYALLGTLVGIGQIGVFGYWMNSYWGGAVAAAGGCLILGAATRLERRPTLATVVLGCFGVVLTVFSRPLEGCMAMLVAGAIVLTHRRARKRKLTELLRPVVIVPVLLLGSLTIAAMAYYNYRVTGKPWLMPYILYEHTYARAPFLLFMPVRQITYRHDTMRYYYEHESLQLFFTKRTHPWINAFMLPRLLAFYGSTLIMFCAAAGALFGRSHRIRIALAVLAALCLIVLIDKSPHIHYIAAGCGVIIALAMYGIRVACLNAGRFASALLLLFVAVAFGQGFMGVVQFGPNPRTVLARELMKTGGQHLVLVHDHWRQGFFDYVYNAADIDGAPIVWARDMGPEKNQELLNYYRGRKVWLLEADLKADQLRTYPAKGTNAGSKPEESPTNEE